ncbi:hypothetical protein, partial [Serratia marcescens]|uniref:hypothetical protein n=1 Tax=Serratia marcescens TaxID=615 RepID=UPI001954D3DE
WRLSSIALAMGSGKASLERALDKSVAIENALKIDEIEADGYTLHITTKEPFPEFISELVLE